MYPVYSAAHGCEYVWCKVELLVYDQRQAIWKEREKKIEDQKIIYLAIIYEDTEGVFINDGFLCVL